MKKVLYIAVIAAFLSIGCASVPEPENGIDTLVIGKIIFEGSGYSYNSNTSLNGTKKSNIKLSITSVTTKETIELTTGIDGLFFSTQLEPGKYLLKKVEVKNESMNGAAMWSSLSLHYPLLVQRHAVNNLGITRWICRNNDFDGTQFLLNKDYEDVYNSFKEKNRDSKWWSYKNINITIGKDNSADYVVITDNKRDNSKSYYKKGSSYYENKEYDKALDNYNMALKSDPKYDCAYNGRGLVYLKMGDYDKAICDFNKAIELNKNFSLPYHNRGICYYKKNDLENSLSDYTKASEIDPLNYSSLYNIACIYSLKKNSSEAFSYLDKAVAKGFTDYTQMEDDKDLHNIRTDKRYRDLIESLKKKKAKISSKSYS